jgi:hypothetical protein
MAIEAVVPAILNGLVEFADRPGGASRLARAFAAQPFDALSALSGDPDEIMELAASGGSALPGLFGERAIEKMSWILGCYIGIGDRSARTLMDLLMSVILGVLGREQRGRALDAEGMSRLLSNERQRIAGAIPTGLTELLKDALAEEAERHPLSSMRWPDGASPKSAAMKYPMTEDTQRDVSRGEWSAWALPVLVALGFVWWYSLIWWLLMPSSPPRVAETIRGSQAASAERVGSTTPTFIANAADNWVSISSYLNSEIHNRLGEKLGTIEDVLIGPDGRFHAVVLVISPHLGIGTKGIAIPFEALHLERRSTGTHLIIDATGDALRSAPAFEAPPPGR